MPDLKVSISSGNSKMGAIPSVSLPPWRTCRKDAPCYRDCYANRYCKLRPNVKATYETNYEILKSDPDAYWKAVSDAVKMTRFFRFHVAGDITDENYLLHMVAIALANPQTELLCFTKQYEIVNAYVSKCGDPPKNLHLIFSAWRGLPMENPFSFPVCRVLYKSETPDIGQKLCGGNCTQCAIHDGGCWMLQKGDTICIRKH